MKGGSNSLYIDSLDIFVSHDGHSAISVDLHAFPRAFR